MEMTIVIPCYNEAENIPILLERFSNAIKDRNIKVILVNNGSNDNTKEVLNKLIPQYCFADTVLVEVNQGYGYGIKKGLEQCTSDYVGWTHADLQTDPKDVVKAYDIISKYKSEKIYVKGFRRNRPLFDRAFTNGMSLIEGAIFKKKLIDINAQPNIFPLAFFKCWTDAPDDFSLDLFSYYMAEKLGLKVIRYNVLFPERIHGQSKWNTDGLKSKWKFIKRTMCYSIQLKRMIKRNAGR